MNSVTTDKFRIAFAQLPKHIQKSTREAYHMWTNDPGYPALLFKKIHSSREIYSVRITLDYRALALKEGDTYIWFWVGSNAIYDKMVAGL
jgi:hypothetical protein